jgi:DNA modification methylase
MAAELETVLDDHPRQARIDLADARSLDCIEADTVDLAVFSPPYPNAFDYHLYHRFRLFWLGYDPRPLKHLEIGAHLRYEGSTEWRRDMSEVVSEIQRVLKPKGHALVVAGDGVARGEVIPSADILCDLAADHGLAVRWRTTRRAFAGRRSFNLSDSGLRTEQVVVLTK